MMTVRELQEFLESCNPDAQVTFAAQPSWPFEYSIAGVCTRADVRRDGDGAEITCEECGHTDTFFVEPGDRIFCSECRSDLTDLFADQTDYGQHELDTWGRDERRNRSGADVILVEGTQLSYADKTVFDVACRGW